MSCICRCWIGSCCKAFIAHTNRGVGRDARFSGMAGLAATLLGWCPQCHGRQSCLGPSALPAVFCVPVGTRERPPIEFLFMSHVGWSLRSSEPLKSCQRNLRRLNFLFLCYFIYFNYSLHLILFYISFRCMA